MATASVRPLSFWASGSDVLMRVPGQSPVPISADDGVFLIEVMEAERRTLEAKGDMYGVADVFCRFAQLKCARMQARRWDRASGFCA